MVFNRSKRRQIMRRTELDYDCPVDQKVVETIQSWDKNGKENVGATTDLHMINTIRKIILKNLSEGKVSE